jgi:uncharacterized protein (UPF0548 family)
MAEWRFLRGWTEAELLERMAAAARLHRNFDATEATMTTERGWSRHYSTALIAREPAGPPEADGAFLRAWSHVAAYAFSDPRIVRAHFDPGAPLDGRVMLLEVLIWGLRYLNPVRVTAVRDFADEVHSVRGFRYETLEGHFERGLEWFLLTKEHGGGEVTFTIHAGWRGGQLPNWWSRVGFGLLALRYQRAWHRLAHTRLRALLGSDHLARLPRGRKLVHSGPPLPVFSVESAARGRPPAPVTIEREQDASTTGEVV